MVAIRQRNRGLDLVNVLGSAAEPQPHRGRIFQDHARDVAPSVTVVVLELEGDEDYSLKKATRTDAQSILLLRVARDAVLRARYHEEHDLTIVCLVGSAIVEVEEQRSFLEPPAAVVVPRLQAYKILPHKTEADFVALLVYSPPFDGMDVRLAEE